MSNDLTTEAPEILVQAMEAHLDQNGTSVEFPLRHARFLRYTTMDAQAALTEVCRRRRNLNAHFTRGGIKFEPC